MPDDKVRILNLEDSESDSELILSELKRSGFRIEWRREAAREGFLAGLRDFAPDVVLADYSLPSYDGLEALSVVRKTHPNIPFIFVTGSMGEDLAVESLKNGATDFVVKSSLGRLGPAVKRALREMAAVVEQVRLHALVVESEQRYRALFENNSDGILVVDARSKRFRFANPKICDMLGYSQEELLALGVEDIHPKDELPRVREELSRLAAGKAVLAGSIPCLRKDKTVFYADITGVTAVIGGSPCLLGMFRDTTERREAERERLALLADQEALIEALGEIAYDWRPKTGEVVWRGHYRRILGYSAEEIGKDTASWTDRVHPEDHDAVLAEVDAAQRENRNYEKIYRFRRADGSYAWVQDRGVLTLDARGGLDRVQGVLLDITEHRRLQEQMQQAQKMESVGRLAGGVAHDFNNLLTAINGYAGFVLAALAEDDPKRDDVKEILAAGDRAAGLTRQLLAFSRKQILEPHVLDINMVVGGTARMLKRLIGEDIKLETKIAPQPCRVKVDAGQLDQVLVNLAVNARDAMPKGGTLTLETAILSPDGDLLKRSADMPRGPVVCMSVRDTGCGMDDGVRAHLFEPFFTTKEKGKGTGLGLATIYGIIKQSGGGIDVESAPDRGTIFRIYLPQVDAPERDKDKDKDSSALLQGHEVVLLVEDEDVVRRIAERALAGSGYTALIAASGPEALRVIERHGKPVDLLVTDVVMPGMSGRELSRALAKKNLVRRTLFISGYTDDAIVQHGVLEPGLAFLYKPFSPNALLLKLREVLDGPADQAKA